MTTKMMRTIFRKIAYVGGRLLILLVTIILVLPIVLLPLSTAVPLWVWILLALADLTLIVLQFQIRPPRRAITASITGMLLVSLIGVIASQVSAATPPINGADGKPIPGSIAKLEKVNLNGSKQWITLRGYNVNKPVLLNLGMGGPGGGGFATRTLFEPLEKDFVVVSWDEPGTGKSYNAVPISTLTPERFVEDAHTLHSALTRTLSPGQDLCIRRLLDKHIRHLAGPAISRALLCLYW